MTALRQVRERKASIGSTPAARSVDCYRSLDCGLHEILLEVIYRD
jgi:hypothetical protein